MKWQRNPSGGPDSALETLRLHLSRPDALLQLAVLGIVTGVLAGGVIVAFRWMVEGSQAAILPGGRIEDYESLPPALRLALPVAGGLLIGLIFHWLAKGRFVVGVTHVLERMAYHQGHIDARSLLLQFVGASVAIISGHSVGREGPSIHLGAASGSLLGQSLSLPNNTIRTMVGCGTAAAISAAFNTPLAGVIFALEVVLMEYTLSSFTPVILAAVSAAVVSIAFFGPDPAFTVPPVELGSLWELPLILLLGCAVGVCAAAYIGLVQIFAARTGDMRFWIRTTLAGFLTGACALAYPQIMGIGYDTVDAALAGELGLAVLAGVTVTKLLATSGCIGLGIPGGLIGPTFFMGATYGSMAGLATAALFPDLASDPALYALLGMGAMMGAALQAPLAALTALLELTNNPHIVFPGMLAVVAAGITSRVLFGKESIFHALLQIRGLDYRHDPIMQALRRIGVASVMDRQFVRHDRHLDHDKAMELLGKQPTWILVEDDGEPTALLPAVDLAHAVREPEEGGVDLLSIPASRLQVAGIHLQANLQEALEMLERNQAEALYVEQTTAPMIRRTYGVLTREQVDSAYRL